MAMATICRHTVNGVGHPWDWQGVILFFSLVYVLLNLLIDLSYVFLDPRIRY